MLPEIQLRFNTKQAERALAKFGAKGHIAAARALNRAGTTTKTLMSRHVAEDTGIKVGAAKAAIDVQPATEMKHAVRLVIRGAQIPLINFRARGPEPSRGRGRGVTAKLKGGRGSYPNAFIATMPSGHRGVFQRSTTKKMRNRGNRAAIYELHGPSLVKVFRKYRPAGLVAGMEALEKNLRHEMDWLVRQAASA